MDAQPNLQVAEPLILQILKLGDYDYPDLLARMWDRNPELSVTTKMLQAAQSYSQLELLLDHLKEGIAVNIEEAFASIKKWYPETFLITQLLLQRKPDLRLTKKQASKVVIAEPHINTLKMLLDHDPSMVVTPQMFLAIFYENLDLDLDESGNIQLCELLERHKKKLVFTEEVRRVINETSQSKSPATKEAFSNLRERDATQEEEEAGESSDEEEKEDPELEALRKKQEMAEQEYDLSEYSSSADEVSC